MTTPVERAITINELCAGPTIPVNMLPARRAALLRVRMFNKITSRGYSRKVLEPISARISAARSKGRIDVANDALLHLNRARQALMDVDNRHALTDAHRHAMNATAVLDAQPVVAADAGTSRPSSRETRAPKQWTPRRWINTESSLWRSAVHEAWHVFAACYFYRPRYIDRAELFDPANERGELGVVSYDPKHAGPSTDARIFAAGWAGMEKNGYSAAGCCGDFAELESQGYRVGDHSDPAMFALSESQSLRVLRLEVQRAAQGHEKFIDEVARRLYRDGILWTRDIEALWDQLRSMA